MIKRKFQKNLVGRSMIRRTSDKDLACSNERQQVWLKTSRWRMKGGKFEEVDRVSLRGS